MNTKKTIDSRPIAGDPKLFIEDLGYDIREDSQQPGLWIWTAPSDGCDCSFQSAKEALDNAWFDAVGQTMGINDLSSEQWDSMSFEQQKVAVVRALSGTGDDVQDVVDDVLVRAKKMRKPSLDSPHRVFLERLKQVGRVWRDDSINNFHGWMTIEDLDWDPNNIQKYGHRDLKLYAPSERVSLRLEATLGDYQIKATIDEDGHLTLWVTGADGSPVHDFGEDVAESDGEFAVRLTTSEIERQYESSSNIARQRN